MQKNRIFAQIYHAIPQKNRRILLISNLQEHFRKIASVERNDETRELLVNKILAVALMSQRQLGFAIPGYPTPDFPGIPYIYSRSGNFNTRSGNRVMSFYVLNGLF